MSFKKLSAREKMIIENFLSELRIINMDETIKRKTITIRKNFGLKLPDCIIAATAISLNMKFISADKQYRQMENLMFDFYQH